MARVIRLVRLVRIVKLLNSVNKSAPSIKNNNDEEFALYLENRKDKQISEGVIDNPR